MMLAGRGMAKVITSGENTDASAVAGNEPLKWFANGFILGIPANFVIAVIIVILVGLLCRKTAMGMMIEAVGINQESLPYDRYQAEEDPLPRLRDFRLPRGHRWSVRHRIRDACRRG